MVRFGLEKGVPVGNSPVTAITFLESLESSIQQVPIALAMLTPVTLLRRRIVGVLVLYGSWVLFTLYEVAPSPIVDSIDLDPVCSILVFRS